MAVLCGGVGAARFLSGLVDVTDPAGVTAIVNVGDDDEFHGLHVSPDIDTILYTLGGVVEESQGWGRRDETFHAQEELVRHYIVRKTTEDEPARKIIAEVLTAGLKVSEQKRFLGRAIERVGFPQRVRIDLQPLVVAAVVKRIFRIIFKSP